VKGLGSTLPGKYINTGSYGKLNVVFYGKLKPKYMEKYLPFTPTSVMLYKTTVAVFKKWLEQGLISHDEYVVIDAIIAEKYGLSLCSIYR
jgi:hypothetical protein